jgi:hypothetical protein
VGYECSLSLSLSLSKSLLTTYLLSAYHHAVRATSLSLGYDIAHCTASAFSPLVATFLVQRVSPVAPGAIYSLFAVLGLTGMFISTKIHQDGGLEDGTSAPSTEMADATEDDEEEIEKEIV